MLSNLAHLRQTSGRLLADLHRWRLTSCAYTPPGRPPADLHRWRLTTCAYTSRQTSGRPPADLQQTSSRYVHLEHSTTSAAPGGSSPSSSGMFLSHYRTFVVVCIFCEIISNFFNFSSTSVSFCKIIGNSVHFSTSFISNFFCFQIKNFSSFSCSYLTTGPGKTSTLPADLSAISSASRAHTDSRATRLHLLRLLLLKFLQV